jgi:uncharacterized protein
MRPELTALEARIIGCLIEKEITTPDQYPLSLNALLAACNQKSNRDPVMALEEAELQAGLDGLMRKHLVTDRSAGFGGRVTRYRHRFCNTQFGELKLSRPELAVVCELLLRGPQTPGELRSRASRMAPLRDVAEAEALLEGLATRGEPLVARLPREAGRRESRWRQLFGGEGEVPPAETGAGRLPPAQEGVSPAPGAGIASRLEALEQEVTELRARLDALATGQRRDTY